MSKLKWIAVGFAAAVYAVVLLGAVFGGTGGLWVGDGTSSDSWIWRVQEANDTPSAYAKYNTTNNTLMVYSGVPGSAALGVDYFINSTSFADINIRDRQLTLNDGGLFQGGQLLLDALTSAPVSCSGGNYKGYYYTDTTGPTLCWCNGTAWIAVAGTGSCDGSYVTDSRPHAEISISDNSTATTVSASSTWYQYAFDTNGESHIDTADQANNKLTVAAGDGIYRILLSASASGGNNAELEFGIAVEGTIQDNCTFHRKMGAGGDVGAGAAGCILSLSNSDDIDARLQNLTNTTNITVVDSNLSMVRIK